MSKGTGFDRLRLASAAVAAVSLFSAVTRSARAGTITQAGVTWNVQNSGSGPGTLPFTSGSCGGGKARRANDIKAPSGTGNGCAMNITDAATALNSDAYDGIFLLAVNGTQYRDPDGVFTTTANSVTGSPATIAGLTVSGEYVFSTTLPVARAIYTFTNSGAAPITATFTIGYNVGSDGSTQIDATSDGDLVVETVDAWTVSSDGDPPGDPVVTLSRFGQGAPVTVASSTVVLANGEEDMIDNYNFTVPAGATRRLMLFSRVDGTIAAAVAAAPTFDSIATVRAAGLVSDIPVAQEGEIVNWAAGTGGESFVANVPAVGEFAKWMLLLGVGGLGVYAMRRRRQRA